MLHPLRLSDDSCVIVIFVFTLIKRQGAVSFDIVKRDVAVTVTNSDLSEQERIKHIGNVRSTIILNKDASATLVTSRL